MKYIFILLLVILSSCFNSFNMNKQNNNLGNTNIKIQPADSMASKEARDLLNYLVSISGKYTLTGQHNFLGRLPESTESIYKLTGKYPAIFGSDFGFADSTHDIDNIKYRPKLIKEIIKQHQRGSIITITYHQANPAIGEPCEFRGGVISKISDKQWSDILTPGTALHEAWLKQMDLIAGYLKQLSDAKIPVLFRPYHEMNGAWFWWGKHKGEKGFKALWIQLFNYYTKHHKLNNLIWVWSPDKPWFGLKEFYPGDEYVDIVACDIYPVKPFKTTFREGWYEDIIEIAKNKPVAIGECSKLPSLEVLMSQPRWAWFMSWSNSAFKANSNEDIVKVYNSDRTITLDKLPKFDSIQENKN